MAFELCWTVELINLTLMTDFVNLRNSCIHLAKTLRYFSITMFSHYLGIFFRNCVTQLKLDTGEKLSSPIFCCLSVCEASVSPDQVSTFSNIYRHTSPLLTLYHLISNSTNLYWSSTSQYRHILTQYHQVPLIINHPERHSSVNLKNSHFTTHLMSHA